MTIQFKVLGTYERGGRLAIHDTVVYEPQAKLAIRFAEIILQSSEYGRVIGDAVSRSMEYGEAITTTPPAAAIITQRACNLAACLSLEMRKREWIVEAPDVNIVYPDDAERQDL